MFETNYQKTPSVDFNKIRVGSKILEDAVVQLGDYKKINSRLGDKAEVLKAINTGNLVLMREISNFFYRSSGIYSRLCRYMARLYKYDWFITPYIENCEGLIAKENGANGLIADLPEKDQDNKKKVFLNFFKILRYFESLEIKKFCGKVALKVVRQGAYYGYLIHGTKKISIQELHPNYCRSRFEVNNKPVVQFNMKYFHDMFHSEEERQRILKLFPKEFDKGYHLYRAGKLLPSFPGDDSGWYTLDPNNTVKFNINEEDFPPFISIIPAIIDLNAAEDLDKKRMAQKLLKIIIQKIPLDKNGDLIFDTDEIRELHNNAVSMLSKAIGVDVLTTVADVDVADMADKGNTSANDQLVKVERAVYNEAGVSQLQFNSDGNIALNNSILNDEASMYDLLLQFESFLNLLLEPFNKSPNKSYYKAQFLLTTIYNYKDMAKLYKQQAQMGYNKMLPQVALGQTQSSILANAYFENDILDLVRVFIPPLTSNTMNAEALQNRESTSGTNQEKQQGRPEKEANEKSEKTIANKQSQQ